MIGCLPLDSKCLRVGVARYIGTQGVPAIARHDPGGAKGVFFGYDFHVAGGGFGLIEINTNTGGAMLNAVLARAHRACCSAIDALLPAPTNAREFEDNIVSMFRREWALCGHDRPLRTKLRRLVFSNVRATTDTGITP